MMRRLDSRAPAFEADFAALLAQEPVTDAGLTERVAAIIAGVRERGDAALVDFTVRFDRRTVTAMAELELTQADAEQAWRALAPPLREALEQAAHRIRDYHQRQLQTSWSYEDVLGNRLGQKVTPLDRVGIYVPGGKASYPSSVLMNAIPAKVAGVAEIIMVVPAPEGVLNPLVLAAAHLAGVDRLFTLGGAQAVAALAYGTETVPRVDKIVGPGNAYVAAAKRQVFGQVGLDMIAGPSEIVVVSDAGSDPHWLAMDLFSQAEHDEEAQSILISPDAGLLSRVEAAMHAALADQPRADIIRASLAGRGALIQVRDLDEAAALCNRIAPEHLQLAVDEPESLLERIRHAGAVFLGRYTAEVMGDYCAGPNHVLPTSGTARFSSPLGVYDFQKRSSIIGCSRDGASELGRIASVLARGESLVAHAMSAECRVKP